MKRGFFWMLPILLMSLILTACAKKDVAGGPASSAPTAMTDASPGEGWPAGAVPSALPAYAEGRIANSGGDATEYTIVVGETNKEALARYLEALQRSGWIVAGDDGDAQAVMGSHTVRLKWNDSASTWLQIDVHTVQAGAWPSEEIPPDILRPQAGALVGSVTVLQTAENMWYFNYTYDGTDEATARAYMELLIENGWSGDDAMVFKEMEW
nr:hypothetical protein [Clostridia bacterium]